MDFIAILTWQLLRAHDESGGYVNFGVPVRDGTRESTGEHGDGNRLALLLGFK